MEKEIKPISPILIQARSGSTRLQNKCFEKIGELSTLEHCYNSMQTFLPTWVLVSSHDKPIIEFMKEKHIRFFEYIGDDSNVAARYYSFLQSTKTDWFCRITADCPFIPEPVITYMYAKSRQYGPFHDIVTNVGARGYVDGWDIEWVNTKAFMKQYDTGSKEHVTAKMYETHRVKRVDMCFEPYKSIDTIEDLKKAREWYERNVSRTIVHDKQ